MVGASSLWVGDYAMELGHRASGERVGQLVQSIASAGGSHKCALCVGVLLEHFLVAVQSDSVRIAAR